MVEFVMAVVFMAGVAILVVFIATILRCYQKVEQGTALVRTGWGEPKVSFSGIVVIPILHRAELTQVSVKRIEIYRHGSEGLICRDNLRADIKVVLLVRVNNAAQDVLKVAQSIGCRRASDETALVELFDAKFSEALKTVGKQFDFTDLYNSRERFKEEILKIIGTDLNGFVLDDAAIDFLEQTPLEKLNPNNILDVEGIKKITELTAQQQVLANMIQRDKEKIITKQNVEAREAILELEKQQVEAEQRQKKEIASIEAREKSEALKVASEELLKSERARIATSEEVQVAQQNCDRQVLVASLNKERTFAVEQERIEKDRQLEVTEREKIVTLAETARDKAVETERRLIQVVIRERVIVERAVVEEQERIKDTQEFAKADRQKQVALKLAEMAAQESLVKEIKAAEASKASAVFLAEQSVIEAEAKRASSEKSAAAKKIMAEAIVAESAAQGLGEAKVIEAKAAALDKQGQTEAANLERKALAEAKGLQAHAEALEKQGHAEAQVLQLKYHSEAQGITEKAEALKLYDEVGRVHEEFKLRLAKEKDIELAAIDAQTKIAESQSQVVASALKSAKIDLVGGDTNFFDTVVRSVTAGKSIDQLVNQSRVLTDVKNTFFNGQPGNFKDRLRTFIDQFGLGSEDLKNLSLAALISKLLGLASSQHDQTELGQLLSLVKQRGLADQKAAKSLSLNENHS